MMKSILAGALALATIGGSLAMTDPAEARNGRKGAFVAGAVTGVVGGALLGGALNRPGYSDERTYEQRPVYSRGRCHMERRVVTDDYDGSSYVKRVRVCVTPGY